MGHIAHETKAFTQIPPCGTGKDGHGKLAIIVSAYSERYLLPGPKIYALLLDLFNEKIILYLSVMCPVWLSRSTKKVWVGIPTHERHTPNISRHRSALAQKSVRASGLVRSLLFRYTLPSSWCLMEIAGAGGAARSICSEAGFAVARFSRLATTKFKYQQSRQHAGSCPYWRPWSWYPRSH